MSASSSPAISAIAFQLVACLDGYQNDVERLSRVPEDMELYESASRRMDEMRLYSASLPHLAVSWVELLIRHFEFTHALWRLQGGRCSRGDLAGLHERVQSAARELSRKSIQMLHHA